MWRSNINGRLLFAHPDTVPSFPEQIEPYLPYEFTCEGMLQRLNAFIENQVRLPLATVLPLSMNTRRIHVDRWGGAAVFVRRTSATGR